MLCVTTRTAAECLDSVWPSSDAGTQVATDTARCWAREVGLTGEDKTYLSPGTSTSSYLRRAADKTRRVHTKDKLDGSDRKLNCSVIISNMYIQRVPEFHVTLHRARYQDNNVMNLVWMRRGNLVWSGQDSATQIKTIDTLVVIQTKPGVAWHGILIHPVAIGFRGRYLSTELGTVWKFSKNLLYETFKFKILF